MRCACSSDLPPLLIALDRFVGVSCVLRALPVFSVVVRVPALWAARTRAVLERNRGAACFRGCCGAPPPRQPPYVLVICWALCGQHKNQRAQKNLVLVRFLYRFVSMMRTTGKPRLALPPGTRAMDLRPKKCALKHNKRRKCSGPSATFRRHHPRQAHTKFFTSKVRKYAYVNPAG